MTFVPPREEAFETIKVDELETAVDLKACHSWLSVVLSKCLLELSKENARRRRDWRTINEIKGDIARLNILIHQAQLRREEIRLTETKDLTQYFENEKRRLDKLEAARRRAGHAPPTDDVRLMLSRYISRCPFSEAINSEGIEFDQFATAVNEWFSKHYGPRLKPLDDQEGGDA